MEGGIETRNLRQVGECAPGSGNGRQRLRQMVRGKRDDLLDGGHQVVVDRRWRGELRAAMHQPVPDGDQWFDLPVPAEPVDQRRQRFDVILRGDRFVRKLVPSAVGHAQGGFMPDVLDQGGHMPVAQIIRIEDGSLEAGRAGVDGKHRPLRHWRSLRYSRGIPAIRHRPVPRRTDRATRDHPHPCRW